MKLKIDFQTHTNWSSPCGWMTAETLVETALANGLDGTAITDHNTMEGVREAVEVSPDEFLVIPSEEIDTQEGQLIGLFLEKPIEPWQSADVVIEEIHKQGGLALAPHPLDELREGLTPLEDYRDDLDAIEVLNSRCVRERYNRRAHNFTEKYGLPGTGGSDAHFAHEVGNAYTVVDVPDTQLGDVATVKRALKKGNVQARGSRGSVFNHAGTKVVKVLNRIQS